MKEISNIEQKKILFLISSIGGGGAERVACRLVSEFSKRHKVYLMYFNKKEKEYLIGKNVTKIPFILDNIKSNVPQTELERKEGTLNQRAIRINEIEKIRRIKNIDITISFLLLPNIYNAFSANTIQRKQTKYLDKFRILQHKSIVYDSLDDEEIEDDNDDRRVYLDPNSNFVLIFDGVLFIISIISFVVTPLYIAYNHDFCRAKKLTLMSSFNIITELL